jgi:hypothetical protein
MKKLILSEQEKDEILGQHKETKDTPSFPEKRRTLDTNLKSMDFVRLKSQGLRAYYFDSKIGSTFGMVELTSPVKQDWSTKPREVFLLTPDEYEKIKKLSDNINEMIGHKLKQIELYKQYIPAIAAEIIKQK